MQSKAGESSGGGRLLGRMGVAGGTAEVERLGGLREPSSRGIAGVMQLGGLREPCSWGYCGSQVG